MASSGKYKWLVAFVLLAVAAVVYYALFFPWPKEPQVSGALTGVEQANRFRADQAGDKDVALDDQTVQKLLQNDKFLTLLKDKQFRDTMSQPGVAGAVSGLVSAVPASDIKVVIEAIAAYGTATNVDAGQVTGAPTGVVVEDVFASNVVKVCAGHVSAETVKALTNVLSQPGVATFMSQPSVHLILSNPGIVANLTDASVVKLFANPANVDILSSPRIYTNPPVGVVM